MSSMRQRGGSTVGRVNMHSVQGVSRTAPTGNLYPAYSRAVGGAQVNSIGGLLQPGTPQFWRFVLVALALGYVTGFHLTIGGRRIIPVGVSR